MSDSLFTRLHLKMVRGRILVILLMVAVVVSSFLLSRNLDVGEDIMVMLPRGDEMIEEFYNAMVKFRQIDRVFVDVSITEDNVPALVEAADAVHEQLRRIPSLERITYRFDVQTHRDIFALMLEAMPSLFDEADAVALEAKLTPDSLGERLGWFRRKMMAPDGLFMHDILQADPVGVTDLMLPKLQPLQAGLESGRLEDGRVLSADGRHALIMAEPSFRSTDSIRSEELVSRLLEIAGEMEARYAEQGLRVAIGGGHRVGLDNSTLIKTDITRTVIMALVAMFVLSFAAYRRRFLAVYTFLPTFFGTAVALIVLALRYDNLSNISIGCGIVLAGITVDYAIHILYHLDNDPSRDRRANARHLFTLVPPLLIGATTTVGAVALITSSSVEGHQQLGLFAAVGVAVAVLFAIFVLPILVPLPRKEQPPHLLLTGAFERFFAWREKHLVALIVVAIVLSAVGGVGIRKLSFDGDLRNLNGVKPETRADDDLIWETWGDAVALSSIIVTGADEAETLRQNDAVKEVAARLEKEGLITFHSSLADICPSPERQRENEARWKAFWTPARIEELRKDLTGAAAPLGFRGEAFARFFQRLESEPAGIRLELFDGTPLKQMLAERIASGPDGLSVTTLVKLRDREEYDQLRAAVRAAVPTAGVIDQAVLAKRIAGAAGNDFRRFAVWAVVVVSLVVFVSFGRIELLLAILVPLLVGLFWSFGLMGLFGLKVNVANTIFVLFVIGVGIDYSVFIVTARLDRFRGHTERLAATGGAVSICLLTTLCGFGVLVVARHPALFSVGITALMGLTLTFLSIIILSPLGLDALLYKNNIRGAPQWHHFLNAFYGFTFILGGQLLLFAVYMPYLRLRHRGNRKLIYEKARRYGQGGFRFLAKGTPFFRLTEVDIKPETFDPPCIIIANHQSAIDIPIILGLPADIRFTLKKRVWDSPLLGISAQKMGHVLVRKGDPQGTLNECREVLAQGASIAFFPEGTRSQDGFLTRFRMGAFQLASELRCDILPLVLCDTWTSMPRDAFWVEDATPRLRALPRITPDNFDYSQGVQPLMRHAQGLMHTAFDEELKSANTLPVLRRKVGRRFRYMGTVVEPYVRLKLRSDPVFSLLDETLPERGVLVDLGCGYGLQAQWLIQCAAGREVIGVDYHPHKIQIARQAAAGLCRIRFEQGDVATWPIPTCDAALLIDVLHYLPAATQDDLLKRCCDALAPGGRLVVRDTLSDKSAGHRKVAFWENLAILTGHNRAAEGTCYRTADEYVAALQQAGFERVEQSADSGLGSNTMMIAWKSSERA